LKYVEAFTDPFRDLISQADIAFKEATSFLCIGYGFNDEHIQPKLLEQIKHGKPIVILALKATDACKKYITTNQVKKYFIIEQSKSGKTAITSSEFSGKTEEYSCPLWSLPEFIKITLGD
jgi:hypothetical protein